MSDPVPQPTLDLGDYRGKKIKVTRVKLANANDGFDPSTSLESPRIYELGERLVLAVEVVVSAHQPKVSDIDAEEITVELVQTFKAGTMAVVPRRSVAKELNAAQRAKDEAEKAKKAGKKAPRVRRGTLRAVGASLEEALQTPAEPQIDPEVST
jgi:hypothetical protein